MVTVLIVLGILGFAVWYFTKGPGALKPGENPYDPYDQNEYDGQ